MQRVVDVILTRDRFVLDANGKRVQVNFRKDAVYGPGLFEVQFKLKGVPKVQRFQSLVAAQAYFETCTVDPDASHIKLISPGGNVIKTAQHPYAEDVSAGRSTTSYGPTCPYCGSDRTGPTAKAGEYECRKCENTFKPKTKDASAQNKIYSKAAMKLWDEFERSDQGDKARGTLIRELKKLGIPLADIRFHLFGDSASGGNWHVVSRMEGWEILEGAGTNGGEWAAREKGPGGEVKKFKSRKLAEEHVHLSTNDASLNSLRAGQKITYNGPKEKCLTPGKAYTVEESADTPSLGTFYILCNTGHPHFMRPDTIGKFKDSEANGVFMWEVQFQPTANGQPIGRATRELIRAATKSEAIGKFPGYKMQGYGKLSAIQLTHNDANQIYEIEFEGYPPVQVQADNKRRALVVAYRKVTGGRGDYDTDIPKIKNAKLTGDVDPFVPGQMVHLGLAIRAGTGFVGILKKIENGIAFVEGTEEGKFGKRLFKGKAENLSRAAWDAYVETNSDNPATIGREFKEAGATLAELKREMADLTFSQSEINSAVAAYNAFKVKTRDIVLERVTEAAFEKLVKEYERLGYSRAEAIKNVKLDGTHVALPGQAPFKARDAAATYEIKFDGFPSVRVQASSQREALKIAYKKVTGGQRDYEDTNEVASVRIVHDAAAKLAALVGVKP